MARRKGAGSREQGEGRRPSSEKRRKDASHSPHPSSFPPVPSAGEGPRLRDWVRPWLLAAATALWVARPMFPSESAASKGDGMPAVMLWLALAVIWLLGAIGQPRFRVRFGWVDLAVLVLVAWHTLAAVWAAVHLSPRPAVNMLWEWVGFAVSFFLTRQLVAGPREAWAMVAVMCSLAVALAAFGLYQYHYEMPATRAAYEADPDNALADAGLCYPAGSPERAMFEKRLASVEPTATFALTNSLAGLLATWLVVLLGVIVGRVGNAPHVRSWFSLSGMGLCALIVAACLVLTKSRSAYLAVLFGLVLVGLAWRRKSARIPSKFLTGTALVAAVLLVAAMVGGGLDRQVLTEAGKSLGYRGQYWQSSLAMIIDHPLVGCGPGNFQDAYKAYKLPEASEEIADPHNFLFEVWATAGTPAMLALAAVLAGFFLAVLRDSRRTREQQAKTSDVSETSEVSEVGDGFGRSPRRAASSGRPGRPEKAVPKAVPPREKQHAAFVCAGALAGFALVVPVAAISVAPPQIAFFCLAVPSVVLSLGSLWSWIDRGKSPIGLAATGIAVLLVNLCAAGGIGFAGVAGSFWLLMAIGLSLREDSGERVLPGWSAFAALAATCVIAFACYATGYGPVLRSHAAMQRAQRHPSQAERHLLDAAHADSLAADPWNQLASLAFAEWRAKPGDELLRQFESYTEQSLARAPNSSSLWETKGERFLEVFVRTGQTPYLTLAVTALRRAVQLYPNSATTRAKLAKALRTQGDQTGYEAERQRALDLDQLTPHLDKKLPDELRLMLQRR